MSRIVLDLATLNKLAGLGQCAELCDPSGTTIGFFTPLAASSPDGSLQPQISDDELQRRETEDPTYSTDEVKAHLEKL